MVGVDAVERHIVRKRFGMLGRRPCGVVRVPAIAGWATPPYVAHSVLRARTDAWLAKQAEEAGASLVTSVPVEKLAWEGSPRPRGGPGRGDHDRPRDDPRRRGELRLSLGTRSGRIRGSPARPRSSESRRSSDSPAQIDERFNMATRGGPRRRWVPGSSPRGDGGRVPLHEPRHHLGRAHPEHPIALRPLGEVPGADGGVQAPPGDRLEARGRRARRDRREAHLLRLGQPTRLVLGGRLDGRRGCGRVRLLERGRSPGDELRRAQRARSGRDRALGEGEGRDDPRAPGGVRATPRIERDPSGLPGFREHGPRQVEPPVLHGVSRVRDGAARPDDDRDRGVERARPRHHEGSAQGREALAVGRALRWVLPLGRTSSGAASILPDGPARSPS